MEVLWVLLAFCAYCLYGIITTANSDDKLIYPSEKKFKGTPQNTGASAQEIESAVIRKTNRNEIKVKALEFKPTIYSAKDQKYMGIKN